MLNSRKLKRKKGFSSWKKEWSWVALRISPWVVPLPKRILLQDLGPSRVWVPKPSKARTVSWSCKICLEHCGTLMMKVTLADVNSGKFLQRGKSITPTRMLCPAVLTRFLDSALDWTAQVHGKGTLIYTYGDKFVGDWVDVGRSATETSRLTSVTWLTSHWPFAHLSLAWMQG